jgi:hypothetical protein
MYLLELELVSGMSNTQGIIVIVLVLIVAMHVISSVSRIRIHGEMASHRVGLVCLKIRIYQTTSE